MLIRLLTVFCAVASVPVFGCGPDKGSSASDTEPSSSTASSTSGDEPTSSSGSSGSSGAPPADDCANKVTQESCLAGTDGGGHPRCAWQPEFAQWSEEAGCGAFAGPPRCMRASYAGEGCQISSCPDFDRVYVRDPGDGVVELMDYAGGCGLAPEGWMQCNPDDPQVHPACACFC